MITEAFDNKSKAIIEPRINENAPVVDACILTFSWEIEKAVTVNYDCKQIGTFRFATGDTPVYQIEYKGKKIAFYKTYVGAPACVGTIEDTFAVIKTKKYVVFGGAGCLDKEIAQGKVMIPTEAYRDEGTSYHYMPASDYVTVKNSDIVAEFMGKNGIPMLWEKHGLPIRFTGRLLIILKSIRRTAVFPLKWSAQACRRCAISEVWSCTHFLPAQTCWTLPNGTKDTKRAR